MFVRTASIGFSSSRDLLQCCGMDDVIDALECPEQAFLVADVTEKISDRVGVDRPALRHFVLLEFVSTEHHDLATL